MRVIIWVQSASSPQLSHVCKEGYQQITCSNKPFMWRLAKGSAKIERMQNLLLNTVHEKTEEQHENANESTSQPSFKFHERRTSADNPGNASAVETATRWNAPCVQLVDRHSMAGKICERNVHEPYLSKNSPMDS